MEDKLRATQGQYDKLLNKYKALEKDDRQKTRSLKKRGGNV